MEMMQAYLASGVPWMDQPVMLHGPREADYSDLTPEQYQFVSQYWLYWYEADHRYSLPVTAFFLAMIGFFTIVAFLSTCTLRLQRSSPTCGRAIALCRYVTYKSLRVKWLRWYSPPLGIWLIGAVGAVFFLAMTLAPRPYYWPNTATVIYGDSPPIATRSGWMSIACLPFVLVLAAKENPISLLTRIPHDRLIIFHRWTAWAMFVLALLHTFPFIIVHAMKGDLMEQWKTSMFYWTGTVALLTQAWLQFMSIGVIRNKFYEIFKVLHFAMAALFFSFLFIHCDFTLTSWDYLISAAVLYAVCLLTAQLRTWAEYGIKTRATLEPSGSGAVRVSIPTTSPWAPGQHIFVRFLTGDLHGMTSHPFTVCSLPTQLESNGHNSSQGRYTMVFFIQPRGGATARLASMAQQQPGRQVRALLDGPYGGMKGRSLATFDKALVIAGGAGAGFTIPIIEDILRKQTSGGDSAKRSVTELRVVIAVRTQAECKWFQEAWASLLRTCVCQPGECACPPGDCTCQAWESLVRVEIYLTDDGAEVMSTRKDIEKADAEASPIDQTSERGSEAVTVHCGARPNLPSLIDGTVKASAGQSLGMSVCGPGAMLYDVQNAAADAQRAIMAGRAGEVYLYAEHFSW